jgi:hypothetical protein
MPNFAGTSPVAAMPETDSHQLIAADLRSLIAQIESSMRRIDAAMIHAAMIDAGTIDTGLVQDDNGDQAGSIFVLDDVTPRYATASAALNACRVGLDHALQSWSESGNPAAIAVGAAKLPHRIA